MAVSRPSDLVGGGGLRAGSGARPTAGAKGKYVSKGTGKTGSNAVKKAKSATKKAAQNSTKVKSNALQKSKTRAKSKGRYDEYEMKIDNAFKEGYFSETGNRTNKTNKNRYSTLYSLPKNPRLYKVVTKRTPNKIVRKTKNDNNPWKQPVSGRGWGGE